VLTVRNWCKTYPEFLTAVKRAKANADGVAENALFERVKKGDTLACIFWLKNRLRNEWLETSQQVNVNLEVDVKKGLSESTRNEIEERLKLL